MQSSILSMLVVTAVSAAPQSHVQVSLGGSTYAHGVAGAAVHAVAPVHHAHAVHAVAPAVHHAHAVHAVHAPAVHHHAVAPVHHATKCSVVNEAVKARVCTPTVAKACVEEQLAVKTIGEREQCQDITRTVCTAGTKQVENEVCVYSYSSKSEETTATTAKVAFSKVCSQRYQTVCQATTGYGHQATTGYGHQATTGYGQQLCKEVASPVCYQSPSVVANSVSVTVSYPVATKACEQRPITLPVITCEDLVESKCITLPELESSTVAVEKCEYALGEQECSYVQLTVPKQVCVEVAHHVAHHVAQPAYAVAQAPY